MLSCASRGSELTYVPVSELRTDPISGRKVLIVEGRAGRPSDFLVPSSTPARQAAAEDNCPFCVGAERQTPSPSLEVFDKVGNWQVRVIPNKYPAVAAHLTIPESSGVQSPFSPPEQAYGAHEVIIESARHVQDVTEISVEQLATVLQVYRDRLKHWSTDPQIRYVQIFKNVGFAAGATLEHIHSQVVAFPFIPAALENEMRGASEYYQRHQRCLVCDLLAQELDQRTRLVFEEGQFAAFCAYAGRQPYETWILPTKHQSDYRELSNDDAFSLAKVLNQVLRKLHVVLPELSYNLLLRTVPFGEEESAPYHWHLEIVPRTTHLAGFEWGTGLFINPLSPERAAKMLLEAAV